MGIVLILALPDDGCTRGLILLLVCVIVISAMFEHCACTQYSKDTRIRIMKGKTNEDSYDISTKENIVPLLEFVGRYK